MNKIRKRIMQEMNIESILVGNKTYFIENKNGTGNVKETLECHIRDNIRIFRRAIKKLKCYKNELGKNNDKEIKIVISKFSEKLKTHLNYLKDLNLKF